MANKFNEELSMITGGKSDVGTPQFMGQQKRYSIDQIRSIIKRQKRVKGFPLTIPSGQSSFNLQLSGTARIFLGFVLMPPDVNTPLTMPQSMTLNINNEVIIEQVFPNFFTSRLMDDEFYFIPRPLSGTDQIKMDFQNSLASQNWFLAVYYI